MRSVIAVYVENKYGVLARVTGLFMRRGFNIDSLAVGETEDPKFSRITITLSGDDYAREQLINQLYKLHNVKKVKLLDGGSSVERELLLIKVKNTPDKRNEIMAAAMRMTMSGSANLRASSTHHGSRLGGVISLLPYFLRLSSTWAAVRPVWMSVVVFIRLGWRIIMLCRTECKT